MNCKLVSRLRPKSNKKKSFVQWPSKVGMFDLDLAQPIGPTNRDKQNIIQTKLNCKLSQN
jgi:hypothetical protein